jgi:uncharacterized repeat protein (TIGR01451 family)
MPVRRSKTGAARWTLALLLLVASVRSTPLRANPPILVTTAEDSGAGSFRTAIDQANLAPGSTILFQIPLKELKPIVLDTALPVVTAPVTIDATQQLGRGENGYPIVEIDGRWTPRGTKADGLRITASNSIVQGLVITRFDGAGIHFAESASNNKVFNCWLGMTYGDMQQVFPNYGDTVRNEVGVLIDGSASSNSVGGADPGLDLLERNVISGNRHAGVRIAGNATGNSVAGNYIGTDYLALNFYGNGNVDGDQPTAGVAIVGGYAQDNWIGSPVGAHQGDAKHGNIIAWADYGVLLDGASGNYVQDNYIGYSWIAGGTPMPNFNGIGIMHGASNNVIGGRSSDPWETASTFGNVITQNLEAGILVMDATTQGNSIRYNSILDNGVDAGFDPNGFGGYPTLGIELGVTTYLRLPNDVEDVDAGPNRLQNWPTVGLVDNENQFSSTTYGSIFSEPFRTYTVDVYMNNACHGRLPGLSNAEWWYGSATVTTDADGKAEYSVQKGYAIPENLFITAIATDQDGSSSEISPCHAVNQTSTADMAALPHPPIANGSGGGGGTGGFAVSLRNNGPNVAHDVVLASTLPAGVTFAACSATHGGVCGGAGNQRQVTFRTLRPGEIATVAISATLDPVVVVPPGDTAGGVGQVVGITGGASGGGSATSPVTFTTKVMVTSDTFDPNLSDNLLTTTLTIGGPDTEPPVITHAAAHPDELWPPDNRLHEVHVSYEASDNVDPRSALTCSLAVPGTAAADAEVVGPHSVRLRARRGQDYAVIVSCTDRAGNVGTQTIHVPVAREEHSNR